MEDLHLSDEWVPVKNVCEGLGLSPDWQKAKLKKSTDFVKKILVKKGRDGKNYKMVCIHKEDVPRYIDFTKTYPRGPYKKKKDL